MKDNPLSTRAAHEDHDGMMMSGNQFMSNHTNRTRYYYANYGQEGPRTDMTLLMCADGLPGEG